MRNPERIERILDKIEAIWQVFPDFRLCQLMVYLLDDFKGIDMFYIEDNLLEEVLNKKIKELI